MKKALIVIAGASRSGKSTLAGMLRRRLGWDVIELDALYRAVAPVIRKWTTLPENLAQTVMQSSALSVIDALAQSDEPLIVEGGWLEPKAAAALAARHQGRTIIVVYLGFPDLGLPQALRQMRLHKDYFSWFRPRAAKERFLSEQIAGSQWYRDQCATLGLHFIDTSHYRAEVLRRAVDEISMSLSVR